LKVVRPFKEIKVRDKVHKVENNEVQIQVKIFCGETNETLVEALCVFVLAKSPIFRKIFGKNVDLYLPYTTQDQQ